MKDFASFLSDVHEFFIFIFFEFFFKYSNNPSSIQKFRKSSEYFQLVFVECFQLVLLNDDFLLLMQVSTILFKFYVRKVAYLKCIAVS